MKAGILAKLAVGMRAASRRRQVHLPAVAASLESTAALRDIDHDH